MLKNELPTPEWKKPYHFGHGLSYTSFAYSNLLIRPAMQGLRGNVTVSEDIRLTGEFSMLADVK